MELGRKILSSLKRRKEEEEKFLSSMRNGTALMEELITCFNGRHKVPIGIFTAKDLIQATNNFSDRINISDRSYMLYKGSLEQHEILVQKNFASGINIHIHNIVITSQMSHHKNVLKLMGCCLEFEYPALVYESVGGSNFLPDILDRTDNDGRTILSWKSRLKIANDIANVIVYLHMAFPSPIIYRGLDPRKVIVNKYGVAKLHDFSESKLLPPGKLRVKESVIGTMGFIPPEYSYSSILSQKTDVYGFGVLLLVLLSGSAKVALQFVRKISKLCLTDCVNENEFVGIVDPKIMGGEGRNEQEQQLVDFLQLAWNCVQFEEEDRPEMIEVARELRQIIQRPV